MNYTKECLYDVEWQKLRCTLLGKWANESGVKQALKSLELYWGKPVEKHKAERVWRTLNLLNAVKLGWAQSKSTPSELAEAEVLEISNRLSLVHATYATSERPMETLWDWNKVIFDLTSCDVRMIKLIRSNLMKRVAHAKRRFSEEGDAGVRSRRPELCYFIDLLDMELMRREGIPVECMAKVREIKSPYQSKFRGYRIVCATKNMAGLKPFTNIAAPSFDRPYWLVSFGDFEDRTALMSAMPKVEAELKRCGFEKIHWYDNTGGDEDTTEAA